VKEAGKEWNRRCLKDGDEFMATKIRILQLVIETNRRGNINDDMLDWIGIFKQLDLNNWEMIWLFLY
jgi:hypothetical protein